MSEYKARWWFDQMRRGVEKTTPSIETSVSGSLSRAAELLKPATVQELALAGDHILQEEIKKGEWS